MKVLIVEDESLIAEMIKVMVEDMGHEVPYVAYNFKNGLRFLEEEKPEFAIFDVNLKEGMEGIELAKVAQSKGIPFMFLTSYSDRGTIDLAKQTKPGAYVIKPFSEEELYSGIEMSLMHLSGRKHELVTIKDGHRNIIVRANEIIYVKADNVYVEIITTTKRYLIRMGLSAMIEELPKEKFIRVHRSFVVNRDFITTHTRNTIYLGEIEVPISRSFKDEVLDKLNSQ